MVRTNNEDAFVCVPPWDGIARKTWRTALEFGLVACLFFTGLAVMVFLFLPSMFRLP